MKTRVEKVLRHEAGTLVMPAPISAEVDYLLGTRLGGHARRRFLEDLAARRFSVECLATADYATVRDLDRRFGDLELGLADLSIIVLASRLRTTRILTFDQRHFRAVAPLEGGSFTLLPFDETPAE